MIKSKKQMFIVIGVFFLVMLLGTVTYAFFNYTRTGAPNRISVGDIYFTSDYTNVSLEGVFPIAKTNISTDTDNVMSVDVDIEGHTTYTKGIYYEIKAEDVNLTINGKNIPIGISVTSSNLDNITLTNYEDGKVLTDGSLFANGRILASTGSTDNSVDGTINIKAYLDKDKIAISDTYNGLETDLMGTTTGWVGGRVVLTTSEWNSLATTPISFKVKVEAYENDVATLVNGTTFIGKIKKLSNPNVDNSYDEWEWWEVDENITTFQRVTTKPDISLFTDANIISTNDSAYPIYAWYESGVIKYYSETDNIKANTDMSYMFCELEVLESIGDLSGLDTTNVIDMAHMFYYCESITSLTLLSNWNVSNVTSMSRMFNNCDKIVLITPLSNWNVSNVIDMSAMFAGCTRLTSLSTISNWNVSNVIDMSIMFSSCSGITDLIPLSNWNISNVTNMIQMFSGCSSITDLTPLSNWNVSNVANMARMFSGCSGITDLTPLSNWNVSNVIDMSIMFYSCTNINDASGINNWDINNVTNFTQMFKSVPTHPTFTKRAGTWNAQGTFIPSV